MAQAKTLTKDELARVLDYIDTRRFAPRNRAMMLLTHLAGLRIGEVACLRWSDVINTDGTVKEEIRLLTTVLRFILPTDRQTAYNYSKVLQVAHDENLTAQELPGYIKERGGIAKITATKEDAEAAKAVKAHKEAKTQMLRKILLANAKTATTVVEVDDKFILDRNYNPIHKLEELLTVLSAIRGEERDWSRYSSTDYLITVAEVSSNLFMSLKYTAQVVEGFNLTDACMTELDKSLRAYSSICSMRDDIDRMWSTLENNKERAESAGIQDPTLRSPDIPGLQKLLHGYGDTQYLKACSDLNDWYNTYRWKVSSGKPKESSAQPEEPAEAV